jgi:hypothetical protein
MNKDSQITALEQALIYANLNSHYCKQEVLDALIGGRSVDINLSCIGANQERTTVFERYFADTAPRWDMFWRAQMTQMNGVSAPFLKSALLKATCWDNAQTGQLLLDVLKETKLLWEGDAYFRHEMWMGLVNLEYANVYKEAYILLQVDPNYEGMPSENFGRAKNKKGSTLFAFVENPKAFTRLCECGGDPFRLVGEKQRCGLMDMTSKTPPSSLYDMSQTTLETAREYVLKQEIAAINGTKAMEGVFAICSAVEKADALLPVLSKMKAKGALTWMNEKGSSFLMFLLNQRRDIVSKKVYAHFTKDTFAHRDNSGLGVASYYWGRSEQKSYNDYKKTLETLKNWDAMPLYCEDVKRYASSNKSGFQLPPIEFVTKLNQEERQKWNQWIVQQPEAVGLTILFHSRLDWKQQPTDKISTDKWDWIHYLINEKNEKGGLVFVGEEWDKTKWLLYTASLCAKRTTQDGEALMAGLSMDCFDADAIENSAREWCKKAMKSVFSGTSDVLSAELAFFNKYEFYNLIDQQNAHQTWQMHCSALSVSKNLFSTQYPELKSAVERMQLRSLAQEDSQAKKRRVL